MPSQAVELVFRFKTENKAELEQLKKSLSGLTAEVRQGDTALAGFGRTARNTEQSLTASILKAELLAGAFIKLTSAVKDYVIGAAQYAARTDQLAIISDSLARVNGLSVQGVRTQADEVRRLGITTQASLETTARLIQARVDLSKAPQLARVAQDAAKIAGINSSEAIEKIVMSIGTGMVRPLHQMGLMVNFQQATGQYAAEHHKNAAALTAQEQAEARLQAVLKAGVGIYGTYEASQLTAGGQMQSLSRYTDELKNKFGEGLQPVLYSIIGTMRTLTSVAGENVDKFQHLTAGAAALAAGGSVFAATGFLPLPYRAGAAALAGGAAYIATDKDPAQTIIDVSKDQIAEFELRQKGFSNDLKSRRITKETYDALTRGAASGRERIGAEAGFLLARIYKQRQERGDFPGDPSKLTAEERANLSARSIDPVGYAKMFGYTSKSAYPDKIDLGSGVVLTGEQLKHEFDADPSGNLKPVALDDDETTKALTELVKGQGKSLRARLNAAKLQMLSGTGRIAQQTAFERSELATSLLGYTPTQLANAGVGGLYGLINQAGAAETAKYLRDQRIEAIGFGGEMAFDARPIDLKRKVPGDDSDAREQYESAIAIADRKRKAGWTTDEYNKAVYAATAAYSKGKRTAAEAGQQYGLDNQVADLRSSSSLQLRLLGIGKTDENAGSLIGQEYNIRTEAAKKEFAITGDIKQLRAEMSTAWADKMVATAEREKALADKQKQDRIEAVQTESQFRSKLAAIQAGPGDQFTEIRDNYRERLDVALKIFKIESDAGDRTKATEDLRKAALNAEHDMVLSIEEIRRKGREEYEATAGKVFDALLARGDKGNAFRQMLLGQVETIGRKVFTNAAGLTFDGAQKLGIGDMIHGQYETNPDGTPKIDPKTGNPKLTKLGQVLSGTPLGTDQAKLAQAGMKDKSVHSTDLNTTSTDKNTEALDRLTGRIEAILGARQGGLSSTVHSLASGPNTSSVIYTGGANISSGSTASSYIPIPSVSSSISFPGFSGGASYSGNQPGAMELPPTIYNDPALFPAYSMAGSDVAVNGPPSSASAMDLPSNRPASASDGSMLPGYTFKSPGAGSVAGPLFDPNASGSAKAMSGMATAGTIYAGAMGVIGGIKKGGAQGAFNAIGSAAGAAAALDPEPISKAILAGVALGSGVISAIIGDPKQNFANKQAKMLRDNRYFGPEQLNISSDTAGNMTSYGFKGNVRSSEYDAFAFNVSPSHYDSHHDVVPGTVTPSYAPNFTLHADFIDPAGLQSRANDIADVVHSAMLKGHPINDAIGQVAK